MSLPAFLAQLPLTAQQRMLLQWAKPAAVFLIALLVFLLIRRILLGRLESRSAGPQSMVAVFTRAIDVPSIFWCMVAALAIALRNTELTERQVGIVESLIGSFLIASFTLAAAGIAVRSISFYGERKRIPFAVAGLSHTLTYVLVIGLGLLTLLTYLRINVTPILTALGVGGLAVALALQDTLANFFAGVHILIENPISLGEFVKLSSGEEGVVTDIGWRTTRLQTGNNNVIVIPNTKITTGILTNFSLPEHRTLVDVPILTGLEADPARVRQISLEVASSVQNVLADPAPSFSLDPGVTATLLQSKLTFAVANRLHQGPAQAEVRFRLLERFRAEGIPLPSPEKIIVRS